MANAEQELRLGREIKRDRGDVFGAGMVAWTMIHARSDPPGPPRMLWERHPTSFRDEINLRRASDPFSYLLKDLVIDMVRLKPELRPDYAQVRTTAEFALNSLRLDLQNFQPTQAQLNGMASFDHQLNPAWWQTFANTPIGWT